jgi:hypothetical protein
MTLALKFWREIALAVATLALLGMGSALHHAGGKVAELRASRDDWRGKAEALTAQIKTQAKDEGHRYENTEAGWLARCRDAYSAGAHSLPNDAAAVKAGRYVPKPSPGSAKR